MSMSRRELIKQTGYAAVGATLASTRPRAAQAQSSAFDIDKDFADFMRGIGGSPSDAGGKVTFTGRDPIVRSHFRLGACMAIPAVAAGVGAAAIWRDRTGEEQHVRVDLRES